MSAKQQDISSVATTMLPTAGRLGAKAELAQTQKELQTLYAALDNVENGLLILDRDLRATYCNPILHRMFNILTPEQIFKNNPPYEHMLRAAQRATAVDLEDYVAKRLAWVKSGDPTPMDLKMTNGTVLRCHLAVLPEGGRMLIYSDITDIMHQAQELERLATTDGMTGIYNRRHFLTLADREWKRACRYKRPLSCLIFDIDYFKSINDKFGHHVGDEVIMHLANVAHSCKRDSDVLARIGGEEFAILLPETDAIEALTVAERLRGEAATNSLRIDAGSIPATVSIGVAARATQMRQFSHLMNAADRAMYEAKDVGRNRVICNRFLLGVEPML